MDLCMNAQENPSPRLLAPTAFRCWRRKKSLSLSLTPPSHSSSSSSSSFVCHKQPRVFSHLIHVRSSSSSYFYVRSAYYNCILLLLRIFCRQKHHPFCFRRPRPSEICFHFLPPLLFLSLLTTICPPPPSLSAATPTLFPLRDEPHSCMPNFVTARTAGILKNKGNTWSHVVLVATG